MAVRDQAVRAGGGSRGVLMLPLYSARWALVSSFSVRAGGVGATIREAKYVHRFRYIHAHKYPAPHGDGSILIFDTEYSASILMDQLVLASGALSSAC